MLYLCITNNFINKRTSASNRRPIFKTHKKPMKKLILIPLFLIFLSAAYSQVEYRNDTTRVLILAADTAGLFTTNKRDPSITAKNLYCKRVYITEIDYNYAIPVVLREEEYFIKEDGQNLPSSMVVWSWIDLTTQAQFMRQKK